MEPALLIGLFRCCLLRSHIDRLDFHSGQFAPMPDRTVITFAPLVFERDDLFIFALLQHFSGHFRAGNEWCAMRYVFPVGEHQHIAEGGCLPWMDIQKIDINGVTFRDPILAAASFDNCVSHKPFSRGEKAAQNHPDTLV